MRNLSAEFMEEHFPPTINLGLLDEVSKALVNMVAGSPVEDGHYIPGIRFSLEMEDYKVLSSPVLDLHNTLGSPSILGGYAY